MSPNSRQVSAPLWQDDILHEDLTVRENLAYSAWLRSNVNMVSEAKGEVVDDVVDLLQLRHVQVSVTCPPPPGKMCLFGTTFQGCQQCGQFGCGLQGFWGEGSGGGGATW